MISDDPGTQEVLSGYRIGRLPEQDSVRFGAKAVWLDRLIRLGFKVPDAVVIPTEAYWAWRRDPGHCAELIRRETAWLPTDPQAGPVLFAARSGSTLSMPGALSTVLNVGADAALVMRYWPEAPAFWKQVALETAHHASFPMDDGDDALDAILSRRFQPGSLGEQLAAATETVFRSSMLGREAARIHLGVDLDPGTSCIIQKMVHGNCGPSGGAGVMATCDPVTGASISVGSFVPGGIGRDVVDARTGRELPISELRVSMPDVYAELCAAGSMLQRQEGYPIELEFVVEGGVLWLLQGRRCFLSRQALAVWLSENVVAEEPSPLRAARLWLSHSHVPLHGGAIRSHDEHVEDALVVRGTAVSGGVADGPLIWADGGGDDVPDGAIVARERFDAAQDIVLIKRARGLITARGGASSHVAALCRKFGKPYVSGIPWAASATRSAPGALLAPFAKGERVWLNGLAGTIGRGMVPLEALAPSRAEIMLDAVTAEYRQRSWFSAHTRSESELRRFLTAGATTLHNARWRTQKARAAELSTIIPVERRIPLVVIKADDECGLRRALLDALRSGYVAGPKCSFSGAPRLGNGVWQFDLSTDAEVEAFLEDPAYVGASGRGGYRLWVRDPTLSEIIVMLDPRQKRPDTPNEQRFVVCMSISADRHRVVLEVLRNTWQLRDFERAREEDVIRISARLDAQVAGDRSIVAEVGSTHMKEARAAGASRRCASLVVADADGRHRLVDPEVQDAIMPGAAAIISTVTKTLLADWWTGDDALPVLMDAFERTAGLDAMEFQGRSGSRGEDFLLIFDLKGGEEARAVAAGQDRTDVH
jgi:pyruvate, orthophosphate dikinase